MQVKRIKPLFQRLPHKWYAREGQDFSLMKLFAQLLAPHNDTSKFDPKQTFVKHPEFYYFVRQMYKLTKYWQVFTAIGDAEKFEEDWVEPR